MKITLSIENPNATHPSELIDQLINELQMLSEQDRTANQIGWINQDNNSYFALQRNWNGNLLERNF